MISYFYSRPYTRGDICTDRRRYIYAISTRAPTRGATYSFLLAVGYRQFLLAPLHEGRPNGGSGGPPMWGISTRAPTRGATRSHCWIALVSRYFYSRPYARGDRKCRSCCRRKHHFYSRPYARGDKRTKPLARRCERLFLLPPLREGRRTTRFFPVFRSVFLLPPLREGRQQFFTKL